ncbi:zinc finger an1 and c2h2 domain-containing stress-associated protein 16-like [Stylonychia lemnae]|uniref:Zinc finger an1 and c2h2 domain-containing stress-associated protein 16-like n=1 Tax=Stylonychia lemnae TaxID=5949 RepID=A0A078BAF7_STYLE|nr:zinc finger an1 and c2h2 domain-containing stress-associated protein 16-like [Stylonychia lemnae]|eukprot:CDW91540.1 zinc finger an1 and c2h2 domain-containing stress-associated protein 16-like [Stylonychia lemnae]
MEFSKIGQHCSFQFCSQQDFLPFECDGCKKIYCADHTRADDHQCILPPDFDSIYVIICPICEARIKIKAKNDPNIAWETHSTSGECIPKMNQNQKPIKKCIAKKCYTKITDTNSVNCPNCLQQVCIAHRFQDDHQCTNVIRNPQTQKSKLLQEGFFKNQDKKNGWKDNSNQPVINHFDYTNLESNINRFSSQQSSQQQSQQNNTQNQPKKDNVSDNFQAESCPFCGQLFRDVNELIQHTESHIIPDKSSQKKAEVEKCPHCQKRFILTELVTHLQQDHFIY